MKSTARMRIDIDGESVLDVGKTFEGIDQNNILIQVCEEIITINQKLLKKVKDQV